MQHSHNARDNSGLSLQPASLGGDSPLLGRAVPALLLPNSNISRLIRLYISEWRCPCTQTLLCPSLSMALFPSRQDYTVLFSDNTTLSTMPLECEQHIPTKRTFTTLNFRGDRMGFGRSVKLVTPRRILPIASPSSDNNGNDDDSNIPPLVPLSAH